MEPLTQYAVLASATITASAASYVGLVARSFAGTVEANETRSQGNRAVLKLSGKYDNELEAVEAGN